MWNGTKALAENIAAGIKEADPGVTVKVYNISKTDDNDVVTEIFKSKAVVIGSPTIMNGILHSIAGLMQFVKELKFKNKKAAAFGCYGWSSASVKIINELLKDAGFELISEGFERQWTPDENAKSLAFDFGKRISSLC